MANYSQLSSAAKLLSAGLIVAGLGIFIQFVTGVPGFPPIPPGPIILIGAGLLVALLPWRWVPVIGLIAALFISVGAVVANMAKSATTVAQLSAPGAFGPFIGTVLQLLGLAVALIFGVAATLQIFRSRAVARDSLLPTSRV